MSGRRGGGRGGGRFGGGPVGPVARDDEGNIILPGASAPPPLFPEMELPLHPELDDEDNDLLGKHLGLSKRLKRSLYYLNVVTKDDDVLDDGLDTVTTKRQKYRLANRQPLSSVMTLIVDYFPEELYTNKERRASSLQTARAQDAYWRQQSGTNDESSLKRIEEHLLKMEKMAAENGEKETAGKTEDDKEQENLDYDTDSEEEMDENDFNVNDLFDDDDGYEDGGDDGGDDGAVY